MEQKTISMIIQGPLVSNGIDGASWASKMMNRKVDGLTRFAVLESLERQVEVAIRLKIPVIIVFWDEFEELTSPIFRHHLVTLAPRCPKVLSTEFSGLDHARFAQFYLLKEGLRLASTTHVIKLRTDIYVCEEDLLKLAKKLVSEQRSRVLLPFIVISRPDRFIDHYFGFDAVRMLKVCDLLLDKNFYPGDWNIHRSFGAAVLSVFGYSVTLGRLRCIPSRKQPHRVSALGYCLYILIVLRFLRSHVTCEPSIFLTMEWRGKAALAAHGFDVFWPKMMQSKVGCSDALSLFKIWWSVLRNKDYLDEACRRNI